MIITPSQVMAVTQTVILNLDGLVVLVTLLNLTFVMRSVVMEEMQVTIHAMMVM
jgi:hypothetical protein